MENKKCPNCNSEDILMLSWVALSNKEFCGFHFEDENPSYMGDVLPAKNGMCDDCCEEFYIKENEVD